MNAPLKTIDGSGDIAAIMRSMGIQARAAARCLALAAAADKDRALGAMAQAVREAATAIGAANSEDLAAARAAGATPAFLDRLALDEKRIGAMAAGLDAIAALADPVGTVAASWDRPNGLHIERVPGAARRGRRDL